MKWRLLALLIGFCIDLAVGDPPGLPHPVVAMGRQISFWEKRLRRLFPATPSGEKAAGTLLWLLVALPALLVPAAVLWGLGLISPWLRLAIESLLCWQVLATRCLATEAMKVYRALQTGDLAQARQAVSMIVGRDTARLDEAGVTRAAVETVAENSSDGVIAPLFFLALGGAPLGLFYKAVNTMDSMLGYIDPPYTYFGRTAAKLDDVFNYIPARLSALLLLAAGGLMGLDAARGWKVFRRDRFKHASPNSAQTEAACAGLLGVRLAGDAWYKGVLHKKPYIGDDIRPIAPADIPLVCRLLYLTAFLALVLLGGGALLLPF